MRVILVLAVLVAALGSAGATYAESFKSTQFRIDESFVGDGGDVNSSSPNFRSDGEVGGTAVGQSASTSFQTQSSYVTTSDPALTFIVNSSSVGLGALSTTAAATGTITFSVINYTSYGYSIQLVGAPPSTGGHALSAMTSAGPSQNGTEQFGVNLKANTSPITFGANPSGGAGVASAGYNASNSYKYVSGDVIASAPKSSAQTDFTLSYLVNAATATPGGKYAGQQTLVCTGTY